MDETITLLESVFSRLKSSFAISKIGIKNNMMVVVFDANSEAAIGISVNNTNLSTFDILYPRFSHNNDGETTIVAAHSNRISYERIVWVAEQLEQFGAVKSEVEHSVWGEN